jgi:hypothetical protein
MKLSTAPADSLVCVRDSQGQIARIACRIDRIETSDYFHIWWTAGDTGALLNVAPELCQGDLDVDLVPDLSRLPWDVTVTGPVYHRHIAAQFDSPDHTRFYAHVTLEADRKGHMQVTTDIRWQGDHGDLNALGTFSDQLAYVGQAVRRIHTQAFRQLPVAQAAYEQHVIDHAAAQARANEEQRVIEAAVAGLKKEFHLSRTAEETLIAALCYGLSTVGNKRENEAITRLMDLGLVWWDQVYTTDNPFSCRAYTGETRPFSQSVYTVSAAVVPSAALLSRLEEYRA